MPRYIYRYQSFKDGKATTHCRSESDTQFMEIITTEGSCTRYAPELVSNMTRVKPRNILMVPDKYWPQYQKYFDYTKHWSDTEAFIKAFALIPWTVDFSTVNLDDYPELFI